MLRKNIRLRKEFLYRKSLEGKERIRYEKKRLVKKAMEEGTEVPGELRDEAAGLVREIQLEGIADTAPMDDEYARAGITDPKVFVTTSRDPSPKLIQLAKELSQMIPNAAKLNRGNHSTKELMEACKTNQITDIIILNEHRGVPDGMLVCHLPFGPTAYFGILNCVMRHNLPDIDGSFPKQYPHLIFDNFTTKLGARVQNILKHLFPVPKPDSHRIVTFSTNDDYISFRHHFYKKDGKEIQLKELGPRFELKPYRIVLGTLEMNDADVEWALRPYMNTANKRTEL
eukprot:Phypoly_transcript_15041.p1 GENE.Phypoly_transcript_15041~~Phypoly_transcript_15041.p1  ORF type:complete len:285 (-),score=35.52 Phypoly_transcript_15041:1-855(-)